MMERCLLRLSVPFMIPKLLSTSLFTRTDRNFLTKNKQLSGIINCKSTKDFEFKTIKSLSKKVKATINDVITCAITTAMHQLFQENGDQSKDVQLVIPANIRFEFYKTREDVKLENKFSAIPLIVPLTPTMKDSYKDVSAVTQQLRNSA